MNEEKMHLINKLFEGKNIRTIWSKEDEKYYISVVDVVGVLSESNDPRNYWKVTKFRLKKEGNESVTNCNQLKLKHQMENIIKQMLLISKACFVLLNQFLVKMLNL